MDKVTPDVIKAINNKPSRLFGDIKDILWSDEAVLIDSAIEASINVSYEPLMRQLDRLEQATRQVELTEVAAKNAKDDAEIFHQYPAVSSETLSSAETALAEAQSQVENLSIQAEQAQHQADSAQAEAESLRRTLADLQRQVAEAEQLAHAAAETAQQQNDALIQAQVGFSRAQQYLNELRKQQMSYYKDVDNADLLHFICKQQAEQAKHDLEAQAFQLQTEEINAKIAELNIQDRLRQQQTPPEKQEKA